MFLDCELQQHPEKNPQGHGENMKTLLRKAPGPQISLKCKFNVITCSERDYNIDCESCILPQRLVI